MRAWAAVAGGLLVGVLVGLLAERSAQGGPAVWGPDLAVGWTFIGAGLVAWSARPTSRIGVLLALTGFAWFVPNFTGAASGLLFLYRGPLVHALLTYPEGRARTWPARMTVVAGYGAAVATPLWQGDPSAVALSVAVAVIVGVQYRASRGRERLARRIGAVGTGVISLALAGGAIARLVVPGDAVLTPTRWVTELALGAVALWLAGTLLLAPWDRAPMTDLVVELGAAPSDVLRGALARALGDPGLQICYHSADGWVDASGQPADLPGEQTDRSVTLVPGEGHPVAALVHHPSVLDDHRLVEAIQAAARLAVVNARLQAEVRTQVEALAASRLRLLEAGDQERERLERQLQDGPLRRLETVGAKLVHAGASTRDEELRTQLESLDAELRDSLDDLARLAGGLHPRELGDLGLDAALRALSVRMPLPVSVRIEIAATEVPPAVAACTYYLCLEALTNVVRHARAGQIRVVALTRAGQLSLEVVDDGVGGAFARRGGGLQGLADRVAALGGSISVGSVGGDGTRLAATIPIRPS